MPKQEHTAPKLADLKLSPCVGCSRCGDAWEDHLYIRGHDDKHYCLKCFREIAVKWPRGGRREVSAE